MRVKARRGSESGSYRRGRRRELAAALAVAALASGAVGAQSSRSPPDWSGVWQLIGPTVFDTASVTPPDGRAGVAGVREHPPLTDAFEALYRANIERVAADRFPDPLSYCGYPAGFPRLMNVPDVYEFVVRPEQTWILTENGPNVMRIYTDGRGHPPLEDLWPTYTGDSVGHWEGDTLVFSTVALKGAPDAIIDRTGLQLSDELRVTTRMRRIDATTLEAVMVLEDPAALTEPWRVTKRYRRLSEGTRVYDYACAENNRNPVTEQGQTLTLGPDGRPIDRDIEGVGN